jgi:hypothetical protein
MTAAQRSARQIASLLVAVGVGGTVAGCGHAAEQKPTASPPAASSNAPAYDISRVDNVKNDFPPGFTVEAHPSKALGQHDIDSSDTDPFSGAKVDPPQCRPAIIPRNANLSVGTQAAGVSGHGDRGEIDVAALRLPQPVAAGQPPAGCDRVTISGSPEVSGTAERVPAPNIDGVTTTGVKVSATGEEDAEYLFTAALNDQTTVIVTGSTDAELNPQQLMSDLLVKAVSAVRGR